jgi:hypothetical protein
MTSLRGPLHVAGSRLVTERMRRCLPCEDNDPGSPSDPVRASRQPHPTRTAHGPGHEYVPAAAIGSRLVSFPKAGPATLASWGFFSGLIWD